MYLPLPPFIRGLNVVKTSSISMAVLIFGIIFGSFLFPYLLKTMIKKQMNLKPNSSLRPMYTKVPFAIDFNVYMFNLTNREEVHNGGKPIVQEVGPYYFEEWKEKFDLVDDEEHDTLTYHYKNTFIFRPDLSGPGLTGNEIITMIHPLVATMALTVNVDKKPMLPIVAKAIDQLFHEPKDMFWTGRVMDVLYDGIPIDCSSTEFAATATCSMFKGGDVKAVKEIDEKTFSFSLFAGTNGTDMGEFKVFRGAKHSEDIGRVISFNDEEEMDVWEEGCNHYVGTDSTIFPPFINPKDGVWAYEPSVCRALGATYLQPSQYHGIPTLEFQLDIGSEANAKECFCRDPPDECPPKGTFDLFRCVGAPMIGSLPHFYNCDPKLVENFGGGIHPNKEKHDIYMHFEIMTGTPVSAAKRLQFNLEVVPVPEVPIMQNVRPMLYPLFWVEEGANLNATFVRMLKNQLFLPIHIVNYIEWICIIGGFLGIILAGLLHYESENRTVEVSKPTSTKIDVKE